MTTGTRLLRLRDKTVQANGVVSLDLVDPDGHDLPEWEPGAHLDLHLGDGDAELVRQYSLCGDHHDRGVLRVAVLREPQGRGGSAYVHDVLEVGQDVRVSEPRNHFRLTDAPRYLFIAGGIGITPILAMVSEVAERGAPWRLVYGGRTRSGMAFADGLVESYGDRVQLWPEDEKGLIDLAGEFGAADPGTAVYSCGPGPLLSAVEERGHDSPNVDVHVERFQPKDIAAQPSEGFEVVLENSGRTVAVGKDQTILDAVIDAGADVDFSCREGTCGTCETAVLRGVPEHRDSVLDEDEQAQNDVMMICVSRCLEGPLVLDL